MTEQWRVWARTRVTENHLPSYFLSFLRNLLTQKAPCDFHSDSFPGPVTVFLLFQVDMDALEVPLYCQCGARPSQGRVFLSHHLPQAGVQVIQLLMESSAELLQEGGVPGSRGVLCVEEVEALLEHLMEDRWPGPPGAGRHSPAPEGIWSLSCTQTRKREIALIWSKCVKVSCFSKSRLWGSSWTQRKRWG